LYLRFFHTFIRIFSCCSNLEQRYSSEVFMNMNFDWSFARCFRLPRGCQAMNLTAALCILVCATSASANQVTTAPGFGPYIIGSGGEFTLTPDAGVAALLGGYANGVTMNIPGYRDSFQTFCVERNEDITANTTYDVTLNNVTVFSGNPLSTGAAYLYEQFATGQLMGYNYADNPAGSRTGSNNTPHGTAFELQRAISYFMGEYSYDPYNIYMNGVVPLPSGNLFAPDNGVHGVAVLNLWAPGQPHDPAHAYQDVLILTVPEPSTFALASLGAAALLALRRRK
jgi:hypothetical protein